MRQNAKKSGRKPPSRLGTHSSERQKEAASTVMKKLWSDPQFRLLDKGGMKGKRHSQESNEKNRKAHVGKKMSDHVKEILKKVNTGRTHSEKTRKLLSKINKGSANHFWKGGVSGKNRTERQNIMSGDKYKKWRAKVFMRDNYTCQECGARGVIINADHIKSFLDFPSLRFRVSNGRTLCVPCHRKTDTYGGRARKKKVITKL